MSTFRSRAAGLVALAALLPLTLARADDPPAAAAAVAAAPTLDGKGTVDYLFHFRLKDLPKDVVSVVWDVLPDGKATVVESQCDDSITGAGPPGEYTVKVRLIYPRPKKNVTLTKTVTVTGGKVTPTPPTPPGPTPPDPGPAPPPDKVGRFVVVEDTSKAGGWRGDVLGSPRVQAYYKAAALTHRLVDVTAAGPDGRVPADLERYVTAARGKDLPWLFLETAAGTPIKDLKAPLVASEFVAALGGPPGDRAMGNLEPPADKVHRGWVVFGAAPNVPLIPRSDWKPVNLSAFLPPVKDQDGVGACNAFATVTAVEGGRAQAGLPPVRLSASYLYGKINGGRDVGSYLEDGLEHMTDHGTVEFAAIGSDIDWRRGRAYDGAAQARSYRVLEAYKCPSFEAMASALQQGFFVIEGLMWYDNFTPDREGWLPAGGRGQAGGHALCGYGLVERNGVWGIRTRNSWGAGWGIGGDCIIPESLFGRGVGGFWAVRSVVQTPTPGWSKRDRLFDLNPDRFALAP